MRGEQDLRKMGGLRKGMPVTFGTMLVATLAIAGAPGLSGFFSKDEILWNAYAGPHGHWALGTIGLAAAGVTAFYMFRLVLLAFFGECRAGGETKAHIHESPRVMTLPLLLLAALSVAGGWIGIPEALGGGNRLHHYLARSLAAAEGHEAARAAELGLMAVSVLVALSGALLAHHLYVRRPDLPERIVARIRGLHRIVANKYYVDEIYGATAVRGLLLLSRFLRAFDDAVIDGMVNLTGLATRVVSTVSSWFDRVFVDGLVNAAASAAILLGGRARRLQTGAIQGYVIAVFGGILALVALYLGLWGSV
jgi:NADH-quinone oxidoreductase subunit L